MQVGRVGVGARGGLHGTSFLWHDPDYSLDQVNPYFQVQRSLDTTLPFQEHVEPERPLDPFVTQEKGYDQAFAQMKRGIEGANFLHGVKNAEIYANAVQQQNVMQGQNHGLGINPAAVATAQAAQEATRTYVAPVPGARSSGAAKTAGDAENEKAAQASSQGGELNQAMSMMAGAVTSAASAAAQAQSLQMIGGGAAQSAASIPALASSAAGATGQALHAHDQQQLENAVKQEKLARAFSKAPNDAATDHPVEASGNTSTNENNE